MPTVADFSKATTPTKGNWVTYEQGDANQYAVLTDEKKWVLAVTMNGEQTNGEQLANLRIMAAAPDLLEALQWLQANPNDPKMHRKALDAIKKAKG